MQISIDNRLYEARTGQTVLEVARQHGVNIPSLCYHTALGAQGACDLCMVEVCGEPAVLKKSCTLSVVDGLQVLTDSEAVRDARSESLRHLLARAPSSDLLRSLASTNGIEYPPAPEQPEIECILCGLCVEACWMIRVEALAFINMGSKREVVLVQDSATGVCISCHACESLCPTGAIYKIKSTPLLSSDEQPADIVMAVCSRCGRPIAPQSVVQYIHKRVPSARRRLGLCQECKRIAALPARLQPTRP